MIVLSLFDGMSCGQIALERASMPVSKYLASEIDSFAIRVTQANYPQTIQIGHVSDIKYSELPKIDLLIGGSPCQGFSSAGYHQAFDDPRSELFYEFSWMLEEVQPKYFLLENVVMKQEYQDVITEELGVEPIKINSALVSAQNRVRLYWTNIPNSGQPKDKEIFLEDIIEGNIEHPLIQQRGHGYNPGGVKAIEGKVPTLTSSGWQHNNHLILDDLSYRMFTPVECERLQTVPDNYTCTVIATERYKMLRSCWTVDVIAHILRNI